MQICKNEGKVRIPLKSIRKRPTTTNSYITFSKFFVFFFFSIFIAHCGYGIYHKVQRGENLYEIAKKYEVPPDEIVKANKKSPFNFDPEKIKPGDYIYIPLDKKNKTREKEWEKSKGGEQVEEKRKTEEKGKNIDVYDRKGEEGKEKSAQIGDVKYRSGDGANKNPSQKVDNVKVEKSAVQKSAKTQPSFETVKQKGSVEAKNDEKGKEKMELANIPPRAQSGEAKSRRTGINFIFPVEGGQIISQFGNRGGQQHKGIDIKAPEGAKIKAAEDGIVVFSGFLRGYGNVIIIKHEEDYFTVYAHNKYNLVKEGEFVRRGQVIAEVGMTGNASTPHLHFEIRKKTKPLNPLVFFEGKTDGKANEN